VLPLTRHQFCDCENEKEVVNAKIIIKFFFMNISF
jgi:hypothetical protein